jgi:3-hydroxyethyl bacteriochlorophyllide a dehydrogenase
VNFTKAVVLERPGHLVLGEVALDAPGDDDIVVDIDWSGISTGTERLLWSGRMPDFPGMGYPLVPGYESVGRVVEAGRNASVKEGSWVFVPGARCFGPVRGLFGGAAERVVLPAQRAISIDAGLGEQGVLLALAATAYHVTSTSHATQPDLIVGHGVLGRLLARLAVIAGATPTVWETNAARHDGNPDYAVIHPEADARRDYRTIVDASGDADVLDRLVARLAPGGEIVLAGFYDSRVGFTFPPAFMREARIRIAAQWQPQDLSATRALVEAGRLSLDGLITHRAMADDAPSAYRTAFSDPACLKMILDWRDL